MTKSRGKATKVASLALGASTLVTMLTMTPTQVFASTVHNTSVTGSPLSKTPQFPDKHEKGPDPQFKKPHPFTPKNVIVSNTVSSNAGKQYGIADYVKPNSPVTFTVKLNKQVLHELGLRYRNGKLSAVGPKTGRFGVLFVNGSNYSMANSQNGNLSYSTDGTDITITANHASFNRYSSYDAYLLTGVSYMQAHMYSGADANPWIHNKGKDIKKIAHRIDPNAPWNHDRGKDIKKIAHKIEPNAPLSSQLLSRTLATEASKGLLDSVAFKTGSAIGEATKASISVANASTSVDTGGKLNVSATDAYGDPATDATVTVQGTGSRNNYVASDFSAPASTPLINGKASIPLSDHSAETVSLKVSVKDNTYSNASDTNSTSLSETFTSGKIQKITVTNPSSIVAGQSTNFTGTAVDQYGNPVADGSKISVSAQSGSVANLTGTKDGTFSFTLTSDKSGTDVLTISAGSSLSTSDSATVKAGAPSKATIDLPSSLTQGSTVTISGSVTDQYGNPEPNTPLTLSGGLTGTFTTNSSGSYSGSVKVGASGAVTATSNQSPISLFGSNGSVVTNITSKSSAVDSLPNSPNGYTIYGSANAVFSLSNGGVLRAWGGNASNNPLGVGYASKVYTPTKYTTLTGVVQVAHNINNNQGSFFLKSDGSVWYVGTIHANAPTDSTNDFTSPVKLAGISNVVQIAVSEDNVYFLKSDGTVWTVGWTTWGALGYKPSATGWYMTPTQIPGLTGIKSIAAQYNGGYALGSDDKIYAWGNNTSNQLGLGSPYEESRLPVVAQQVSGVTQLVSGGSTAYILKSDGTVWSWGSNLGDKLGNGSSVYSSSALVQVEGLTNVKSIAATSNSAVALTTSGSVYAWGYGTDGELGTDSVANSSPVKVTGIPAITSIETGSYSVYATDTQGILWAWGGNAFGQLGIGSTQTNVSYGSSVPVQVTSKSQLS